MTVEPAPLAGSRSAASSGEGRHVVQSGETLWGIGRDLLNSTASNASVAEFVSELWELNAASIRSGDPDLIVPGQVLVLPRGFDH